MTTERRSSDTERRRELRANSTAAERLLWACLRAGRLSGMKFRRQHSVGPFIIDFACVKRQLAIELDGDYHDEIVTKDLNREDYLQRMGWQVVRFSNQEVLDDVEAVAVAIARHLHVEPSFRPRSSYSAASRKGRSRG